ncbi:MAG: hypothetical protein KDE14_04400 [Rhodobacteraceae bacterium]|nr:hypothetical protein [Paracoccaceae bacterium]
MRHTGFDIRALAWQQDADVRHLKCCTIGFGPACACRPSLTHPVNDPICCASSAQCIKNLMAQNQDNKRGAMGCAHRESSFKSVKIAIGIGAIAAAVSGMPAVAQDAALPRAAVVKGANIMPRQSAYWVENGERKAARGKDVATAPKDATVIDVKVFDLGGGQNYREIKIRKGDAFSPPKGRDALIFVLSGKLDIKLGDVTDSVGPGDSFRKIAAQDNLYTAVEETVIVETDAPALEN